MTAFEARWAALTWTRTSPVPEWIRDIFDNQLVYRPVFSNRKAPEIESPWPTALQAAELGW